MGMCSAETADISDKAMSSEPRSFALAEVKKNHVLLVCELFGWNRDVAAQALGVSRSALHRWLHDWGIKRRKNASAQPRQIHRPLADIRDARQRRAEEMAALYRDGLTLLEIGTKYGITRERVRQLLAGIGVTKEHGGAHVKCVQRRAAVHAERDNRCREKNGMALEDYNAVRRTEATCGATAREVFSMQRRNMKNFGYDWTLTFGQWWDVWQQSGKWELRGKGGASFWLVRKNNTGAYAAGNVEVVLGAEFVSFVRETERMSGRGIGRVRNLIGA